MGYGKIIPEGIFMEYAISRFSTIRRQTREVIVGGVGIGGNNPIRIQSMTTSQTTDVDATVSQCVKLAEAGCEIIRLAVPNVPASQALKEIHKKFRAAGFSQPLVADVHFMPAAAMEAIEHVEKVRINPGNYADKSSAKVRSFTDKEYAEELERVHAAVAPLIHRAKELGKVLRIGTNHGSLSERTLRRFGDTPAGMVEAALEFVRICEAEDFHDVILSMKSSNPKIMIAAYRLAVKKMSEEAMDYPIHLGVTEAGDGEDARIKSAMGIGALLIDGIGDTVRVSLTEDPWREIPVCKKIIERVVSEEIPNSGREFATAPVNDRVVNPYEYARRPIVEVSLPQKQKLSTDEPPKVFVFASGKKPAAEIISEVKSANSSQTPIEGLVLPVATKDDLASAEVIQRKLENEIPIFVFDPVKDSVPKLFEDFSPSRKSATYIQRRFNPANTEIIPAWIELCERLKIGLVVDATAGGRSAVLPKLKDFPQDKLIFTTSRKSPGFHTIGSYRQLVQALSNAGLSSPLWIRAGAPAATLPRPKISTKAADEDASIEAALVAGTLLCDGLGDIVSVENAQNMKRNVEIAYAVLQAAKIRRVRTEYVACPSCGRTLYDIQTTLREIKKRTSHLSGVTIAVMGCIVNGPGEMADADFGYVGGAPGKINLYVKKECVETGVPQEKAVERLVELIKSRGKWRDAKS